MAKTLIQMVVLALLYFYLYDLEIDLTEISYDSKPYFGRGL